MKLKLHMSCHLLNVYTKFQIDISKHIEKKSRKSRWTDRRMDKHCHGIICPFFKRAYKNNNIFDNNSISKNNLKWHFQWLQILLSVVHWNEKITTSPLPLALNPLSDGLLVFWLHNKVGTLDSYIIFQDSSGSYDSFNWTVTWQVSSRIYQINLYSDVTWALRHMK